MSSRSSKSWGSVKKVAYVRTPTNNVPIFPLSTVLYPEGVLSLRVFEPRYLDMVSACLKEDRPFGVCLIAEEGSRLALCTPIFIVFERGSNTAIIRWLPTFPRKPASVLAIAVGWCAKSSYSVISLMTARTSILRFTFWNVAKDAIACDGETPTWCAAAIAPSALDTLCWPLNAHLTLPAHWLPW